MIVRNTNLLGFMTVNLINFLKINTLGHEKNIVFIQCRCRNGSDGFIQQLP